ncbi:hypothetical protein [Flavobacterium sp. RSP15]|uniref:hypothetical protein n=1 Tax=Flavobacterium sp. RSP15 TaxID=2497485 RepID=UPI000F824798|nr:hypothetical protein [Flavobacterium sp. RSP15]RTY85511.1 hypothetical protein EKM00_14205 [Flavobacterium sp. RSP15]
MKKLLFVFTALLLLSCSSSSDDDNSSNLFNPPSWIQGTWSNEILGVVFKKNDFCTRSSNLEVCLNEHLIATKKLGVSVTIDEDISGSEYKFSYTIQGLTSYFHFKKITSTEIELVSPIQGLPNTSFIKQ